MGTEDLINLPASSSSGEDMENNDLHSSTCKPSEADSLLCILEVEDKKNEVTENNAGDVEDNDSQPILTSENGTDLVDGTTILQARVKLTEEIAVKEQISCFSSTVHTEYGYLNVQAGSPLGGIKRDGSSISNLERDGSSISGVKRPRMTFDEQQPSVHVIYDSLSSGSKQKLEELLQQWSEWHARHYSSSHESKEAVESGEKMYFPALHVGLDKPSAVSFWMDNQTRNPQSKEFIPLDSNSVPLYDRGYSMGLTSEDDSSNLGKGKLGEASRCFNCGSYDHALKECSKPRDNVAVNNARKQHNSKRNQKAGSRKPTRYYQDTPGGKYDGLRPGVLDADTRKLLGLGELDPPPWLNRMREMGYPPGYLDLEDKDQPSGITIFAEEEIKEETEGEDGEILGPDHPEPPRKMSIEFPGINAPIPDNADERRWAGGPRHSDPSRNRSNRRSNNSSELTSKRHQNEPRWAMETRDDGPPGVDPRLSPSISSYSQRYDNYESSSYISYSPRGNIPIPISPSFQRSLSERGRRSPLVHDSSLNHSPYGSLPGSPLDRNRLVSPHNYGSPGFENRNNDPRNGSSSHHRERYDVHHHPSRR